jgi:UDP-N-acetyl-D-mannosaminuronic acid dehydrogenase
MLMAVSRVNESVPLFLVEGIKSRLGSLKSKKVAVLGLTFKRNSDDLRDSLSLKLIRLLERELADVASHDPRAPVATDSLEEAVSGAKAVVVATNHDEFADPAALRSVVERAADDCLVVDPWNVFGAARVFASARDVESLVRAGTFEPTAGLPIDT